MTKEEIMITSMLNITSWELNRVKKELEDLDDLVVERDLLSAWTKEEEGLELFGEELARIEAEIVQSAERKKMLERQHSWFQRKYEWLNKQLPDRDEDEEYSLTPIEMGEETPF